MKDPCWPNDGLLQTTWLYIGRQVAEAVDFCPSIERYGVKTMCLYQGRASSVLLPRHRFKQGRLPAYKSFCETNRKTMYFSYKKKEVMNNGKT